MLPGTTVSVRTICLNSHKIESSKSGNTDYRSILCPNIPAHIPLYIIQFPLITRLAAFRPLLPDNHDWIGILSINWKLENLNPLFLKVVVRKGLEDIWYKKEFCSCY